MRPIRAPDFYRKNSSRVGRPSGDEASLETSNMRIPVFLRRLLHVDRSKIPANQSSTSILGGVGEHGMNLTPRTFHQIS